MIHTHTLIIKWIFRNPLAMCFIRSFAGEHVVWGIRRQRGVVAEFRSPYVNRRQAIVSVYMPLKLYGLYPLIGLPGRHSYLSTLGQWFSTFKHILHTLYIFFKMYILYQFLNLYLDLTDT